MKTVTLLAFIGSNNLGDEAINLSILNAFSSSNYELQVISFNPEKTKLLVKIAAVRKCKIINIKNIRGIKDAINNCDLLICGGGGIIQDQSSIYNLPWFLIFIAFALHKKRKVMLYGVGVGPLYSKISKLLVRRILNKVNKITVRDKRSKEILIENGVNEEIIEVTADPAISLEITNTFNLKLQPRKKVIAVCLRHWFDIHRLLPMKIAFILNKFIKFRKKENDHFISELAMSLNYLMSRYEMQLFFFPFWVGRDSIVNNDVFKKLNNQNDVIIWDKEVDPLTALSILKNADLIIGMRLHSIIFAATLRKKFLAINYSQKVKNFIEMLFEESFVNKIIIDPGEFTSKEMINKLDDLLRIKYVTELDKSVRNLEVSEKRNFDSASKLLNKS